MDINKIIQHNLPLTDYFQDENIKTQIFIHHTAGNNNAIAVVDDWKNRADRVATAFIIAGNGDIVQAFSSKHWAYHLGLQTQTFKKFNLPYKQLDRTSVAIEICNWGYLTKTTDGKFKTYVNTEVPKEQVIELETEYRGFKYYHQYNDAQLKSLKELLIYLCDKYNIPKVFHQNQFDVNADALGGASGIWTHTSVRFDKTDCSPQPNLIQLLTNLTS